jgi:hypothetical protein
VDALKVDVQHTMKVARMQAGGHLLKKSAKPYFKRGDAILDFLEYKV